MRKSCIALLLLVFSPFALAQSNLNNESIIKMAKSGLSDDVIVAAINNQDAKFELTADQLINLKSSGVSDRVLAAMLAKGSSNAAQTNKPTAVVDDLTAAYKQFRDSVVTVLAEYGPAKGTGFIIDPSGLVLTNQHVVRKSEWVAVQLNEHVRLRASVLATDPEKDIAVLRINPQQVPHLTAVTLLKPGEASAEEGERVFTIGSPLNQSKVMTTGIVSKVEDRAIISDININHGNSGGPLFNSRGTVIGITTFLDTTSQGGPGISGIVRIEQAYTVVERAKQNLASAVPPSAQPLPLEPSDSYPLDVLKQRAADQKFKVAPYTFNAGDYEVALVTPILTYRKLAVELLAGDEKNKRNRKSSAAVQNTFEPLDDLKGWQQYVGEYQPVLLIQASPKLVEGFWSAFGRGMAQSHGYVPAPASLHFKTDFYRMRLLCGDKEIEPLVPGKAERVVSVNNQLVRVTDATFDGLYEYPANAIRSECGKVTLELYSEKDPNKPLVHTLDSKTVQTVVNDFSPYLREHSAKESDVN